MKDTPDTMTQPNPPVVIRKITPEENPEWSYEEMVKQHGRVTAKKMVRDREPTVTVWIQPTEEEQQQAEANGGKYLPQWVMVDGTRYPVNVGEETTFPQSVWEAYKVTKKMTRRMVPGVFTRPMGEELPIPR